MSRVEWVRTALAVHQAGSITAGAHSRSLSQPAASQQIAALERALGIDLFVRHRSGVRATDDGARFLGQVAGPFGDIEWLLSGLDAGRIEVQRPLAIGCQPEWFDRVFLPHYDGTVPVRAHFGSDTELLDIVASGRIDIAITEQRTNSRRLESQPCGNASLCLVAAPALVPTTPLDETAARADWIAATPWVGFSEELPMTRKFWSEVTGSLQPAAVALVAPDLRVVMNAVEQALGASLVPHDVCRSALARGRLVEAFAVQDLLPQQHRWLTTRRDGPTRPELDQMVSTILEQH